MESNSSMAVRVGIFFTLALVIVMFLTFQVGGGGYFDDYYRVTAHFKTAQGIDPGTKVALRGIPVGTVEKLDWDLENYQIRVTLKVESKYRVPETAKAKIQMGSLLGGSYVNLSLEDQVPGSSHFLKDGDHLETIETLTLDEAMTMFADITGDAKQLITNLDEGQRETLGKLNDVIEENREEFRQTSESFARLGPKLEKLSDDLTVMAAEIKSGEGTLGKIYSDPTLYNDLREIADTAKEVTAQIKSGEGSLGQLIYKDDFAQEANKVMADLQSAANEVQSAIGDNREGISEAIASLSETGPRIEQAVEDFKAIAEKINRGEGTLGRLVNDPSLYDDTKKTVNQVGESFENAEEQGVFRSFLGLVFGALI